MSYLPTNYDEILKRQQEAVASKKTERDGTINTLYDSQKTVTTDEYNRATETIEKDYADQYQKNAVQKLINERQIAETNENLGLTDSGLNRTQQTAAQLSYANQKGKLDIAKQTALDEKSAALASAIASIEQNRLTALDENATYWQGVADSNAQAEYAANMEHNAALYKTEQEELTKRQQAILDYQQKQNEAAANKLFYNASGYDTTKGQMKYVGSDGKTYYFDEGKNPYTGNNNTAFGISLKGDKLKKVLNSTVASNTQKSVAKYGVFETNGYQPKGVVRDGIDYGTLQNYGSVSAEDSLTGKKQNVWVTTDKGTHYWFWDGSTNDYIEVVESRENGETVWRVK